MHTRCGIRDAAEMDILVFTLPVAGAPDHMHKAHHRRCPAHGIWNDLCQSVHTSLGKTLSPGPRLRRRFALPAAGQRETQDGVHAGRLHSGSRRWHLEVSLGWRLRTFLRYAGCAAVTQHAANCVTLRHATEHSPTAVRATDEAKTYIRPPVVAF